MTNEKSNRPPTRVDVVVIGGGIVGVSTAWFLARQGVSVFLCEKGEIGAEQSGRNQGWVRVQKRNSAEMPLIMESMKIWRELNQLTGAESGFRQCGITTLFSTEKEQADHEDWLGLAKEYGVEAKILTSGELRRVLPGALREWRGALYTPHDGCAEPTLAPGAIARAAVRAGATVLTQCAVRSVETAAGRICSVVTERGRVACSTVVLAGGVWSTLFCRNLGIRLPQLLTMTSILRTGAVAGAPEVSTKGPDFVFRKRLDGGYNVGYGAYNRSELVPDSFRYFFDFLPMLKTNSYRVRLSIGRRTLEEAVRRTRWSADDVSPFESCRTLTPVPSRHDIAQAKRNVAAAFPAFQHAKIVETWAGLMDVMPDITPVISEVEALPGFFISSGYSGHGFGIGPAAGRLTADLVLGTKPVVDPRQFRFDRIGRVATPSRLERLTQQQ